MDLITAEIKALQTRCSRVESENRSLRTRITTRDHEIQLLNKCVNCANQLIGRLTELTRVLESVEVSRNGNNLADNTKSLVKRERLALNVCYRQLSRWRNNNLKSGFEDNTVNTDHTYASFNSIADHNSDRNTNTNTDHCSSPQFLVIPKSEPIDDLEDLEACQSSQTSTANQFTASNKSITNDFLLATEYFSSYFINDKTSDGITVTVDRTNDALDCDNDQRLPVNVLSINLNEDSEHQSIDKPDIKMSGNRTELMSIPLQSLTTKTRQNYFNKSTAKWEKTGELFRCLWKGCDYTNRLKANLMKHHRRCHDQKHSYNCPHCSKPFTNYKIMRSHLQTHKAGKLLAANNKVIADFKNKLKAKSSAKTSFNINTVLNITHRNQTSFVRRGYGNLRCPIPNCNHKYYTISGIWRHMRSVHGIKCYQSVRKQYEMRRSGNSGNSAQIIDQIRIERNAKYLAKRNDSASVVQNDWRCDYVECHFSYNTKSNLKRHQMTVHKRLSKTIFSRYVGQPGYRFFIPLISNAVNSDVKSNTKAMGKPTVKSIKTLANTIINSSEMWFCDFKGCGRYYSSNASLRKHQKLKHVNSKRNAKNRKTNNNSGTKDARIYKCVVPQCGACFIYEKNLNSHLKNKHTPDISAQSKPKSSNSSTCSVASDENNERFECPYERCEYFTYNKITFMRHYNAHFKSEEKPFKCVIVGCNYASNDLRGLRNHVLNKHSEQQFLRAMERTGIKYPLW